MQYAFIISFGNARMQIVLKWTIDGYDGTENLFNFQLAAFAYTLVEQWLFGLFSVQQRVVAVDTEWHRSYGHTCCPSQSPTS